MQHLSDALNALHEDCAWFARAREVRLLVARTSSDVRGTVLKLLPGYEFHADNRSPWVVMEDAWEPGGAHWQSRAARLLHDWERRREAFAAEGTTLPDAVPPRRVHSPATPERPGTDLFLTASLAVLGALRPPLDGLVLVLAPTLVDDVNEVDADLAALLGRPELAPARVVLVLDHDAGVPARTLEWLGDAALACDCRTDPRQKRADLQAVVDGGGVAAPAGVAPPRRVNAPPPPDPAVRDAALREAGDYPAYQEAAPELRRLILGGAVAMGEGRHADAVAMQEQAVSLTAGLGMHAVAVTCRIALASYLSGAGDRPRALAELAAARETAATHGLADAEAQALLAEGLLHALDRRHLEAAGAYYRCAQISERAGASVLAIEAWRLAGQTALQAGATEQGAQYLQRALVVSGELAPAARAATSAPEAARALAKAYASAGYAAHADALYAQADALEQPAPEAPVLAGAGAAAGAAP